MKDFLKQIPPFQIEVGSKTYLDSYFRGYSNRTLEVKSTCLEIKDNYLIGLVEGKGLLRLSSNELIQDIEVEVVKKGTFKSNWNFDSIDKNLIKNVIVIGDSVSAEETYDNAGHTYTQLICEKYGLNFKKNFAIGGTTATYMYEGSNIEKEYKDNLIAIDGCRVAFKAFKEGLFNDVDLAFIGYGHNDQYFQPPVTVEGDDKYNIDNYDSAHSFKGSYRFIINLLRKANPNIKIVLLNCTYSEYSAKSDQWEKVLSYSDYRKAIFELAKELDCKYIDPWETLKPYYDNANEKKYYNDEVHITRGGHKVLADFISKN